MRHRRDGERDEAELWTGAMREAIHCGAVSGGPDRVYYFVLVGEGWTGRAWQRDYFGCAAYIAGQAAEVMAGMRESTRKNDYLKGLTAAAGLMAHELAHCFSYFGAKHLDNLERLDGAWDNLMGMGYTQFPECILNQDQRESLSASPFLADTGTLLSTWRAV